jgi:hypothetical protein
MARNTLKAALEAKTDEPPNEELFEFMRDKDRMEVPTLFCDDTYLQYWKGHIKILFAELGKKGEPYWRTGVLMEARDVRDLAKRLNVLLDRMEAREPGTTGLPPPADESQRD